MSLWKKLSAKYQSDLLRYVQAVRCILLILVAIYYKKQRSLISESRSMVTGFMFMELTSSSRFGGSVFCVF